MDLYSVRGYESILIQSIGIPVNLGSPTVSTRSFLRKSHQGPSIKQRVPCVSTTTATLCTFGSGPKTRWRPDSIIKGVATRHEPNLSLSGYAPCQPHRSPLDGGSHGKRIESTSPPRATIASRTRPRVSILTGESLTLHSTPSERLASGSRFPLAVRRLKRNPYPSSPRFRFPRRATLLPARFLPPSLPNNPRPLNQILASVTGARPVRCQKAARWAPPRRLDGYQATHLP